MLEFLLILLVSTCGTIAGYLIAVRIELFKRNKELPPSLEPTNKVIALYPFVDEEMRCFLCGTFPVLTQTETRGFSGTLLGYRASINCANLNCAASARQELAAAEDPDRAAALWREQNQLNYL